MKATRISRKQDATGSRARAALAGFVLAAFVGIAAAAAENLLTCPGFETAASAWREFGSVKRYRVEAGKGRGGGRALAYAKKAAAKEAKWENAHFDQVVAVKPDTLYVAGAWFRSPTGLRPVLRIADERWHTLAQARVEACPDWREVHLAFRSGNNTRIRFQIFGGSQTENRETAPGLSFCDDCRLGPPTREELRELGSCRVRVGTGQPGSIIPPLFFGSNTLFMVDDDQALADPRLAENLRALPCRLLRYPGGDVSDNYHWRTHSLDNPAWWPAKQGPDTTDTDEFMAFRDRVGAAAILVINLESGFVHDDLDAAVREAAAWVKYCNRQKGYGVRWWELGNEIHLYNPGPKHRHKRAPVSAREYAEAYLSFSRAMKAVDPSIKLGAVGPRSPTAVVSTDKRRNPGDAWWPILTNRLGENLDFVVVHRYFPATPDGRVAVGREIAPLRTFLDTRFPARRVPIALTEWNVNRRSLCTGGAAGLAVAEAACQFLRAGVDMACFWPLRLGDRAWGRRALLEMDDMAPLPAWHALHFLAGALGDRWLACDASNPDVYACASRAVDGTVAVFLVNHTVTRAAVSVEIHMDGRAFLHAEAAALAAAGEALAPRVPAVSRRGDAWSIRIPPASLTRIRFRR